MNQSVVVKIWKSINHHWPRTFRTRFIFIFLMFLLSAVLDIVGLASFVPLVLSLTNPEILHENEYFSRVYSGIGFESQQSFFMALILSIFIFFLLKNAYGALVNRIQVKFSVDLSLVLANKQYSKYAGIDYYNHRKIGSGKVINYVNNTPFTYITTIVMPLFNFLSEGITFLIVTLGIALVNFTLFVLLGCFIGPATLLFYRAIRKRSQHIGYRIDQLVPENINNINDAFKGFVELKLYDKHDFFRKKFLTRQEEIQRLNGWSILYSYITPKVTELIAVLGVVVIFSFGILSELGLSELLALVAVFAGAAYRLMPSLNRIIAAFISLKKYQYTIDNLHLHSDLETVKTGNSAEVQFSRSILFRNVNFRFEGADQSTLYDLNLEIVKGQKIGVIGTSGSGKTTMANLLLGLYSPSSGSIQVDDVTLSDANLRSWYKKVGYVKQDGYLMNDSIANNITLGEVGFDQRKIDDAIDRSSLRSFIDSLPDKEHSMVGENGGSLSGGQRQRVAIARALYQGAEVLVFDEATSALDSQTEKEISESIDNLSTDLTVIIIAHRTSTLKNCDRIWEFKEGRLQGEYPYSELNN